MSYAKYGTIGKDKEKEQEKQIESSVKKVHDISSLEEREAAIKRYPVVIIDYYTTWCGPCKQCAPKYAVLAEKYEKNGILFLKENAESGFKTPVKIRGVPCFHFYFKGNFIDELTVTGADMEELEKNILKLLKNRN
jgi:thiol-disulfide isomerase/thioredoxin